MMDHIHLLVRLSPDLHLSDLIRRLKSASTKWIRRDPNGNPDFTWQQGYSGFTVGYSNLQAVFKYIENQKQHHSDRSFDQEYRGFLDTQKIDYDERFFLG